MHEHAHGHHHGRAPDGGDRWRLLTATLLTGGFMIAEAVGGLLTGSLALLADAGHMLTDTVALALAWVAFRLTDRPADRKRTFGYHRWPVLAAFVNGLALVAIVLWIAVEAIARLFDPQPVLGGPMLVIAALGLVVNIVAFALLHGGDRENMNLRGAALHVLGDLLGSVGALAAAGVIMATGWTPIDPLLSLLVSLLLLRSAWYLLRRAGHVLLEGAPPSIDPHAVERELPAAVAGVCDVHHVHVWSLSPERPMMSLHARATGEIDHDRVVSGTKRFLRERFGIEHTTLQVEYADECVDQAPPQESNAEAER